MHSRAYSHDIPDVSCIKEGVLEMGRQGYSPSQPLCTTKKKMTEKVRITGLTEKSLLSSYIAIIRLASHAVNQGLVRTSPSKSWGLRPLRHWML